MGRVRSAILLAALVTGGAVGASTLDAAGAQAVRSPAAPANGNSVDAAVSADGRFVAFTSGATNLVRGDTNGLPDVFVRDRAAGTTELVSVAYDGARPTAIATPSGSAPTPGSSSSPRLPRT